VIIVDGQAQPRHPFRLQHYTEGQCIRSLRTRVGIAAGSHDKVIILAAPLRITRGTVAARQLKAFGQIGRSYIARARAPETHTRNWLPIYTALPGGYAAAALIMSITNRAVNIQIAGEGPVYRQRHQNFA